MTGGQRIAFAAIGVALAGFGTGEHLYRRVIQRRYHDAVEGRRQLELHFGEVLAERDELKVSLARERQRVSELSGAVLSSRSEMEHAVGRLAEETQSVRQLKARLSAMHAQMDQLQGELAVTLQHRPAEPGGQAAVQLERIVVNTEDSVGLRGRIVSVDADWKFVIIDLGWNAVSIGDTVSIFRNEQLLGRARVERVQEGVCAAALLPEWDTADIRENDVVRVL